VALQVNATIENAATRTGFTGTSFAKGTEISLFADGSTTPLTYTAGADGNSFSSTPGYLFGSEQSVKFTAVYPAFEAGGEAITVSTATQSNDLDILFANGKASIFAPELSLKFAHVMSKLTFTLTAGDGFTAQELQDATVTLTGITTDATFSTTTGAVTIGSTKGDVTAAKQQSAGIGGGAATATAEAIVVPQSATFTLKVTINNMDYTKKLTATLAAGNNYSYPVTLNKQSMTVGSVTIADWTDKEADDDVNMKYQSPIKTITNKADVRKYDYLMKDGTFLRVDVNNLDKLSESDKANIAGVVFWTKEENADGCPDLSTDGTLPSDCQHGLVVSVNEYSTVWMNSATKVGVTEFSNYKLNGYSNTNKLKEYNAKNPEYPVLAVTVFANEKDIANTSGWYLPSSREGVYLYGGTTIDSQNFFTPNHSELDNFLTNGLKSQLWTSEESTENVACVIASDGMGSTFSGSLKRCDSYVRPVCAF
jgi:hypothetical protein